MLVLARKEDESIVIGDNIKLYVRKISPTRVRIAIEAPPHVRVTRQELHEEVEQPPFEVRVVQVQLLEIQPA
jgi:carbon storage regulator